MKNILRENMRRFGTKNLLTEENRFDAIIASYLNGNEVNTAAKQLLTEIKDGLTNLEFRFYTANKNVNGAPEKKAEYDTTQQVIMKCFKGDLANLGLEEVVILPLFKEGTDYENDFLRGGVKWYTLTNEMKRLLVGKKFQQASDLVNTTYTELDKLFK